MFEAQILYSGTTVYSPWMQRGGDNATITAEVIDHKGGIDLEVTMATKSSEDAGAGNDITGTSITFTTPFTDPVVTSEKWIGEFKELLRYRFAVTNGTSGTDWALFRMHPASWYDDVAP